MGHKSTHHHSKKFKIRYQKKPFIKKRDQKRKFINKKKVKKFRRIRKKPFLRRKLFGIIPYYITFSIILVVLGIFIIRISPELFGFSEITFWIVLLGWGILIAGMLMLIAYWRNNVVNFNAKFKFH